MDGTCRRLAGPKGAVFLAVREFAVVQRLAARPGAVVPHTDLVAAAFPDPDAEPDTAEALLRQIVSRLRAVLVTLGAGQHPIVSERRLGYRLMAEIT